MKKFLRFALCIAMVLSLSAVGLADDYSSTTGGNNALSVTSDETYSNITVTKTGDVSGQSDNYDWQGTNAAVRASNGAKLTITGSSTNISSNASYGNAVFSYGGNLNGSNNGDGTTITISDATITTTKNNSGGIMATGGGVINATNLTVTTSGGSSAAIRSDKGGGTITVTNGTFTTSGSGSPAIYSTAAITVTGADLTSNVAQGVVIEGGNSVTLNNVTLKANHNKLNGQDTTYQAVMLYQSMSGDASNGASKFTMTGGSLTNTKGAIFHVTNTTTTIALNGVSITNNDSTGAFLTATADSWGTSGSNGGQVTLNATDQTIAGNMIVDSVSSLKLNLSGTSKFTGAITSSAVSSSSVRTSSNGGGNVAVTIDSGATWVMTGNSTVNTLTNNGSINYGSYTLTVGSQTYNASNPYSGGSSSSNDDTDDISDLYPDATVIVLKSDGTATVDGETIKDYGFVWHCEPSSSDEWYTLSKTDTQAYDEDAILETSGAKNDDVYIAHDIRYLTSNADFTGATATTSGGDAEYVAYYDDSVLNAVSKDQDGVTISKLIFATLPTQMGMGMGGTPGERGGNFPGGTSGDFGGQGGTPGEMGRDFPGEASGDFGGQTPPEIPNGGQGGTLGEMGGDFGGQGGTPPDMPSNGFRPSANTGNIAAFATMTHNADEAYENPVLHITEPGTYAISGKWNGQIWLDVGKKNKINLVLNGVEVNCDVGPAIVFYKAYECEPYDDDAADTAKEAAALTATASFDVEDLTLDDAGVIVEIASGTKNVFTGSNTPRMLEIGAKSNVTKIDGTDYKQQSKRYKLDGAFHSRRSMLISGDKTGALSITSTTAEGLDSEMHMTIIGGSIDVTAPDDGINVNEDYVSVFTLDSDNNGILSVTSTGADGIDSNGYIILQSGKLRIYTQNESGAEGALDALDELGSAGIYQSSAVDYQWGQASGNAGGNHGGSGGTQPGTVSGEPVFLTSSLPSGTVNTAYSATITAEGNVPLTWKCDDDDLPDGLAFKSSGVTATISGTPTSAGTFTFNVEITNQLGAIDKDFSITIVSASQSGEQPSTEIPSDTYQYSEPPSLSLQTIFATDSEAVEYIANAIAVQMGAPFPDDVDITVLPNDAKGSTRALTKTEESIFASKNEDILVVLETMKVSQNGIYYFKVPSTNLEAGESILPHMLVSETSSGNSTRNSSVTDESDNAVFVNDSGEIITKVPAAKDVNIVSYMKANVTYTPVVTTAGTVTHSRSHSSGCNAGFSGLAMIALALCVMRRRGK